MPKGRSPRQWTKEEIALLGTTSDEAVGRMIGVCQADVNKKRRQLGIPANNGVHNWTEEELALLREPISNAEISRQIGLSRSVVGKKRKELGLQSSIKRHSNKHDTKKVSVNIKLSHEAATELARLIEGSGVIRIHPELYELYSQLTKYQK